MRRGSIWAGVAFGLALVLPGAACGGSNGSGGSGGDPSAAAAMAGQALCSKIESCSSFFVQLTYGDTTTCGTRVAKGLLNALNANGTGWTPSSLEACGQAIAGASCDDALGNNLPAACHTPAGQLANGTACGDSSQCSSGYCNIGTDGICGACGTARAGAGSPCHRNDDCSYGLLCAGASSGTTGTCAAPGAAGAHCDGTHPCQPTLRCKNGTCATPDAAGAACTVGNGANPFGSCDELAGDYCAPMSMLCTKITLVGAGTACGLINNALTSCSGGGQCPTTTMTSGMCVAPADDGASCNTTAGPGCLSPAVCRNGVCTVPSPATCH